VECRLRGKFEGIEEFLAPSTVVAKKGAIAVFPTFPKISLPWMFQKFLLPILFPNAV
jgi:hypothetical protein